MADTRRTSPLFLLFVILVSTRRTSSLRALERTEDQGYEDDDSTNRVNDACEYARALSCENGSTCKMGTAAFGYHGTLNLPFLNKTANEFMHCVCPYGFTGVLCEHHVQTCGGNEHACFNGATCVKKGGQYSCDCATSHSSNAYAGHMCEHAATSFCEHGVAVSKHSFCVNKGTCIKYIIEGESHMGCKCPEGFSGEHCQYTDAVARDYKVLSVPTFTPTPTGKGGIFSGKGEVISVSLGISLGAVILFYIMFIGVKIVSQKVNKKKELSTATKDHSLTLEADGGTMPAARNYEKQIEMKIAVPPKTLETDGEFL